MLQIIQNQRVHIINLGLDSRWIIDSFKKSRPDRVYLIKNNLTKKQEQEKKAKKAEKEIKAFLEKLNISLEVKEADEDIYSLIKILGDIISREKENFIYLGISTGIRDYINAFILSSMIFKRKAKEIHLYTQKEGEFKEMPSFEVKLPDEKIILALKFIAEKGSCTKRDLKNHMFEKNILEKPKKSKFTGQSEYVKLNRSILEPAEKEWRLIEIEGRKKGSKIKLTPEGSKWIKIF